MKYLYNNVYKKNFFRKLKFLCKMDMYFLYFLFYRSIYFCNFMILYKIIRYDNKYCTC